MACTALASEHPLFYENKDNGIECSLVFRLFDIESFSVEKHCVVDVSLSKEPSKIVWNTGVFIQEFGVERKYKQSFCGSVFISTEEERSIIEDLAFCCDVCFFHAFKNGVVYLHGVGGGGERPYHKAMFIRVLTEDFKTKKLPFTAEIIAECTDTQPCFLLDRNKHADFK